MLTITYEYKLRPTKYQSQIFATWLNVCRQVYNYALRERKDWVNSRKSPINTCSLVGEYIIPPDISRPTYASQCKSLAEAKKIYPELKIPHSQVLQQTLKILESAFVAMWDRGHGFPRFKKRMRSFVFPAVKNTAVGNGQIDLPKIGTVKMKMSRTVPEGFLLKQIRIVKKASGYFAVLTYQLAVSVPQNPPFGQPLGVDIGLDKYLVTSAGELVNRPRFFNALHRELKLLQRRLKLKRKGSNNWLKLQNKIARIYQRINDTRKDWHYKLAHHLCDQAGMIFVEDINFKAWAKGMFGKHTLDAAYGQFFSILSHVCWKRGVYFQKVDKNYTSQTCPSCGTLTGKKTLNNRVHSCQQCGYETHRDVAAAQVIRNRGILEVAVPSLCGGTSATVAVGQPVSQIASGGVLSGIDGNIDLESSL